MLMLPTWPVGESVDHFTSRGHWEISSPLTTNHLLTIVALTNTLMSMNSAAFTDGKIMRQPPPRCFFFLSFCLLLLSCRKVALVLDNIL